MPLDDAHRLAHAILRPDGAADLLRPGAHLGIFCLPQRSNQAVVC
jgi:hypothetical protein